MNLTATELGGARNPDGSLVPESKSILLMLGGGLPLLVPFARRKRRHP